MIKRTCSIVLGAMAASLLLGSCDLFFSPSAWSAARGAKALMNALLIAPYDQITDTQEENTLTRVCRANDGSVVSSLSYDTTFPESKLSGTGTVAITGYYDREYGYTIGGNLSTNYLAEAAPLTIANATVTYTGKVALKGGPVKSIECAFSVKNGALTGGTFKINGSVYNAVAVVEEEPAP